MKAAITGTRGMKYFAVMLFIVLPLVVTAEGTGEGEHLFILSGQSNMALLNPTETFTPTVNRAFGADNVIVVKDAVGGQPIRRWYKNWQPEQGDGPEATGDLYDRLMHKVQHEITNRQLSSVTFIWMQGEQDAREGHGGVYAASLHGLMDQLHSDLQRDDINLVIGRLSDFDMANRRFPHWTRVRQAQVRVAESLANAAWVNTDDLNDGLNREGERIENDLHYSVVGYRTLGRRFAETAIQLINQPDS